MRSVIIGCAVMGLAAAAQAAPYSYTETFTSSNSGWASTNLTSSFPATTNNPSETVTFQNWESTGDNSTGWLPATRNDGTQVFFNAYNSSSSGNFDGNLATKYGDGGSASQMAISFDMRRFQLYDNPGAGTVGENYIPNTGGAALNDGLSPTTPSIYIAGSGGGTWSLVLSTQPNLSNTQWTRYSTTFNFNWTDAQAEAAGWTQTGGVSFATTLTTVNRFYLGNYYKQLGTATKLVGIDNVTFATVVPEPANGLMAALAIGGLLLVGGRRRTA
jgi:hypothetical protein